MNNDFLTESIQRENDLFVQLTESPVYEITGVVGLDAVGAAMAQDQEFWTIRMTFDAWRVDSSDIRVESLEICKRGTKSDVDAMMETIEPDLIISIRARFSEQNLTGKPQALLVNLLSLSSSDTELQEVAQELKKPVTFEEPQLGLFTYDRRTKWYSAKIRWNWRKIDIHLNIDKDKYLDSILKTAHALRNNSKYWNHIIYEYAARKLLQLKNEYWLDEDEKILTKNKFKSRLKLDSISINEDGTFDFWLDDGNLFLGHTIQVTGDLKSGLTSAGIVG